MPLHEALDPCHFTQPVPAGYITSSDQVEVDKVI